jgi:ribose transport system substrate-binding protein
MFRLLVGRRRGWLTLTVVMALSGVVAASATLAQAHGVASAAKSAVPYNGPEKNLPHNLANPKIKKGYKFTVGFMSPNASIASLSAVIAGARAEVKKLGGKFILEDGQLNPNMQATQINTLITQGVNAMMVYPVNPAALLPGIKAAAKKGIKIVTEDTPPTAGAALIPGTFTDVLQGRDAAEYGLAQAASKADAGGTFANLGLAVPVPLLQYGVQRDTFWAKKFGMKFAGTINTTTDTTSGAANAMSAIIAKYPKVTTVFAYNDQAAEAAAATARADGKTNIKIWGDNGEPVVMQDIKAGRVYGTFNSDFTSIGRIQAIAVYDLLTKQHLPLPKQISVGGLAVTSANVGSANPLGVKGPLPNPA